MAMIKVIPSLTEDHIQQAVMTARAILALQDRLERALAEVERLKADLEQRRSWSTSAQQRERKLQDRLFAVDNLHSEATRVTCGDGCCHEELGHCGYCNEPYPCRTVKAAMDKDDAA